MKDGMREDMYFFSCFISKIELQSKKKNAHYRQMITLAKSINRSMAVWMRCTEGMQADRVHS